MLKIITLFVGFISFTIVSPAFADMTARQIIHAYETKDAMWSVEIGLIENGFSWANIDLDHKGVKLLYCSGHTFDGGTLESGALKMISVVQQYLKVHPENIDLPIGLVLLVALEDAYPCR